MILRFQLNKSLLQNFVCGNWGRERNEWGGSNARKNTTQSTGLEPE